ncbi:MAG: dockerin type I domain-containing protein [Clostridia bacterium]|nr:dockerin type I domain-containing protein [Clostridia bacterium]
MKRLPIFLLTLLLIVSIPLTFAQGVGGRLIGDCDGDGDITAIDASAVLRHVVLLERLEAESWYAADADGDNALTAFDASSILRNIVKLDSNLGAAIISPPAMISNLAFSESELILSVGESATVNFSYVQNGARTNFSVQSSAPTVISATLNGNSVSVTAHASGEAVITLMDSVSHRYADIRVTVDALYENILVGLMMPYGLVTDDMRSDAAAIYAYVKALDESLPSTKVVLEGMKLMGTDYSTLDCSNYTRAAFVNAGYGSLINAGSNNQINKFRQDGCLHDLPVTADGFNLDVLRIGYVLLWTDAGGEGNHSAIYLGKIDGQHWIIESTNGANGVNISTVWNYGEWNLRYYANPLDSLSITTIPTLGEWGPNLNVGLE